MFILIVHSDCVALYKCKSALALEISVRILDNKGGVVFNATFNNISDISWRYWAIYFSTNTDYDIYLTCLI